MRRALSKAIIGQQPRRIYVPIWSQRSNPQPRFAFSRKNGDVADAAADAEGKSLALVFVDDQGRNIVPNATALSSLTDQQLQLVKAVSAKKPNTVVVINTGTSLVINEWVNDLNVK